MKGTLFVVLEESLGWSPRNTATQSYFHLSGTYRRWLSPHARWPGATAVIERQLPKLRIGQMQLSANTYCCPSSFLYLGGGWHGQLEPVKTLVASGD